jgi:hypothetical protein
MGNRPREQSAACGDAKSQLVMVSHNKNYQAGQRSSSHNRPSSRLARSKADHAVGGAKVLVDHSVRATGPKLQSHRAKISDVNQN